MTGQTSKSAALPVAHAALRILIVANWLMGVAIFILLVAMPTGPWIMSSLQIPPSPDTDRVILGLQAIAAIGLVGVPFHYVVLRRLIAIIETVRAGDPFVVSNADRLRATAWALLALQLLSLVVGAITKAISTPAHPFHFDAGFSISGWLAVLLTFVLARVFAEGARMRDDLEGTV